MVTAHRRMQVWKRKHSMKACSRSWTHEERTTITQSERTHDWSYGDVCSHYGLKLMDPTSSTAIEKLVKLGELKQAPLKGKKRLMAEEAGFGEASLHTYKRLMTSASKDKATEDKNQKTVTETATDENKEDRTRMCVIFTAVACHTSPRYVKNVCVIFRYSL